MNGYAIRIPQNKPNPDKGNIYVSVTGALCDTLQDSCIIEDIKSIRPILTAILIPGGPFIDIDMFESDLNDISCINRRNFEITTISKGGDTGVIVPYDIDKIKKESLEIVGRNLKRNAYRDHFSYLDRNKKIIEYLLSDLSYFYLRVPENKRFHCKTNKHPMNIMNLTKGTLVRGFCDDSFAILLKLTYGNRLEVCKFKDFKDKIEKLYPDFFDGIIPE